jgi:mono/diheme cytochrome c family protein
LENIISTRLRDIAVIWAVPILLGIALGAGLRWLGTPHSMGVVVKAGTGPVPGWAKVTVDLPTSQASFPPGKGADIANAQCLICHSAGMVLRQPPLTQDEWAGEIHKMRNSFGAPLPADQVEVLAEYLRGIQGGQSPRRRSVLDAQGS